jgi:hypothetical protein
MPCSLTYDGTLARVRVDASSLGGTVTHATVERSDDLASTFQFIRGGDALIVVSGGNIVVPVDDYEYPVGQSLTYRVRGYDASNALVTTFTCSTTVNQSVSWLKSVERPFLNRPLNCTLNPSPLQREARQGIWNVIGRSFPVATTDVRSGVNFDLIVVTSTYAEQEALDFLLASGDLLYLQPKSPFPVDGMFLFVDDVDVQRPSLNRDCGNDFRRFVVAVTQIEPLDDDVVGTTVSWYTVITTYASWSDVISANATWADLLEDVADPSEVIIP